MKNQSYKLFFLLFFLGLNFNATAQNENKNILDSLHFYGSLRVHLANYNNKIDLQENSPRVGIDLKREIADKNFIVYGKLEYAVHITDGINFNNDANTSKEFLAEPVKIRQPFASRLAFVGLSYKNWGKVLIGKQWGVYYDIANYTDNLTPFGGNSLGVYTGITDGGWKGTGRADKAITYRNSLNNLSLGLQIQLLEDHINYGSSLEYNNPSGLSAGVSFNRANISERNRNFVKDIGSFSDNLVVGVKHKYKKGVIATAYAYNEDEIKVINDSLAVSFPAHGLEFSFNYRASKNWNILSGINFLQKTKVQNLFYNQDYKLLHLILGLEYFITPNTIFYSIGRLSNSENTSVLNEPNILTLGFRYNFNLE